MYYLLSDEAPALETCWIIGDEFLTDAFGYLQEMKGDRYLPYLYRFFDITAAMVSPVNLHHNIIGRLHHSLVSILNKKDLLPKFLIVIFDDGILHHAKHSDGLIKWLHTKIYRLLVTRH